VPTSVRGARRRFVASTAAKAWSSAIMRALSTNAMSLMTCRSFVLLAAALAAAAVFAAEPAPVKTASATRTPQALQADVLFWRTLHAGDYEHIDAALQASTGAYLADPGDALTAAHVGWLHIWRLAESGRVEHRVPTITDDAILARRYFEEAVALKPDDARFQGFLASAQLAEGGIHRDPALVRRGEATMQAALQAWPEFNLFTAGYVASGAPADSARFREGLEMQWRNMEACLGRPVDRANPDIARYRAGTPALSGDKLRACGNTDAVPHNLEGFYLNFGDMLVKAGDWQTARKVYANAMQSPTYAQWPFAADLERRIAQAPDNVAAFNGQGAGRGKPGPQTMANSNAACMACHQR
jgi:hypothetical protein